MSDASHAPQHSTSDGSHYQPSLGIVLLILILFVGAVFVMLRSNSPPTSVFVSTTSTTAPSGSSSTTLPKNKVPIQVSNGTDAQDWRAHSPKSSKRSTGTCFLK